MHADEVRTDASLVRRLLAAQFPRWAHLPVSHLSSAGTDNAIYRVGPDLVARLPRIASVQHNIDHEARWVPHLAPLLPVPLPVPVAVGEPGEGYPFRWAVCGFLPGENPRPDTLGERFTADLAAFLRTFHALDPAGAPVRGKTTLARRDEEVHRCIAAVAGHDDLPVTAADLTAAWEVLRDVPPFPAPGVWAHGDVTGGNLLVRDGRLGGVLDLSGCGLGDPAVDAAVAWNLLPGRLRPLLREELGADDDTWARSAGWALSQALVQLPYYRETNRPLAANARCVLAETVPFALSR
ncbi:phosphotransferase [Kineococcus sp. NUM-3379]